MVKTYFLAPTRDCPPSGPIALGSIIASPSTPEEALNPQLVLPIETIHESYQTNWTAEVGRYKQGKIGIWTKFLQVLGVGVDLSVSFTTGNLDVYQFDRIDTKFFIPDREYIEKSVASPSVQALVSKSKFRANLYMITGIKIARGAAIASSRLRDRGINLQLGVDGTAVGAPMGIGPDVELASGKSEGVSFEGASDFVFAFRLREIVYSKRRGVESREIRKGALFGLEGGEGERDVGEEEGGEVFELVGAGEGDVGAEDVEMEGSEVVDGGEGEDGDGEVCECVVVD